MIVARYALENLSCLLLHKAHVRSGRRKEHAKQLNIQKELIRLRQEIQVEMVLNHYTSIIHRDNRGGGIDRMIPTLAP